MAWCTQSLAIAFSQNVQSVSLIEIGWMSGLNYPQVIAVWTWHCSLSHCCLKQTTKECLLISYLNFISDLVRWVVSTQDVDSVSHTHSPSIEPSTLKWPLTLPHTSLWTKTVDLDEKRVQLEFVELFWNSCQMTMKIHKSTFLPC